MENLFLVVNPKSGTGRIKTELFKVCDILTRGGYRVTVHVTSKKGDATAAVENLGDEYSTIVVCGGDGTLNEVITGVMRSGNDYKIGYIPSGTLNEWSQGLKISRSISKAARNIVSGRQVQLDIGRFGESYFSYTASFGAFTEASYSAPQNIKNVLGQVAYLLEGIKALGNIKPIHLRLTAENGDVYEGDYLFGAVSNSMSVGGIIKLDKAEVALNDGLFEVILIENPDTIADLNEIIDAIVTRRFNRKCIKQFKTHSLRVECDKKLDWTLDGEHAVSRGEIVIEDIKQAVNFIIP